MNIQEYISSGIVESYVLGLASKEERKEFEQNCLQYPEVMQARVDFENVLEKQAIENAIAPPSFLRDKILGEIREPSGIKQPAPIKSLNWLKWAAAACLLLLIGSVIWNISLFQKTKTLKTEYEQQIAKLDDMEKDMHILQNPNIKMTSMKGLDVSPQSYATVYWDTLTHDVYLLVNNLPIPAADKQYQLWAIINQKPVDLGVFDIKKEKLLIQAKNAQSVEAFAITLEKKGGSQTGPQGDMYVMGKL